MLAAIVLMDTCQLLCAVVLHLEKLVELARVCLGLSLLRLDLLLVGGRGEAVVVDVDSKEFALAVSVNHQLDGGYLWLLTSFDL